MTISLGRRSPGASSDLPGGHHGSGQSVADGPPCGETGRAAPLFGLAPGGVCRARPVTRPAGELLPRRFTLAAPMRDRRGGLFSVALSLLGCPSGGRYPPPCAVESGLSSLASPEAHVSMDRRRQGGHPAHHETNFIIACRSDFSIDISQSSLNLSHTDGPLMLGMLPMPQSFF